MHDQEMRGGLRSDLEFLVLTMRTDEGLEAAIFGFAGRGRGPSARSPSIAPPTGCAVKPPVRALP